MPSTWSGTASNQLITFSAMKDAATTGEFDAKVDISTIPTGTEIVTKADIQTYLWVDGSASPWNGYTTNRCPPKSSLVQNQYCGVVTINFGDILSSTGNTSYPDGTVYVRTNSGTISYTIAGNYDICDRPTTSFPSSEWTYYYAYDNIQYGSSTVAFYPNGVSCGTNGCVGTAYSVLYDAFACAGCTGGGSSTTIYVTSTPTWVPGTLVSSSSTSQVNVPPGRYVYAGKCYLVQNVTQDAFNGFGKFSQTTTSQVVSVTNC